MTPKLTPTGKTMRCRYCGHAGKLVNAHVIPEGFFRRLWDGGSGPQMLSNAPGSFPKRAPIGAYDQEILCERCEPTFGAWDNYAQQLLREDGGNWRRATIGERLLAYEGDTYDYARLKLFVLSVLWRASVSSHRLFKRVRLGPHESPVLEMLKAGAPGESDTYAVLLAKFIDPPARAILDPHATRFDGVNYYQIFFGSFLAYVKVDQRVAQYPLRDVQLSPSRPLVILGREMQTSKEFKVLHDIANAPQNSRA